MNIKSWPVDTKDFSNDRLGIDFTTNRPISADVLADSFKGLSALYKRDVTGLVDPEFLEGSEFILYITKIESKCIYTELAAFAGSALPVIQAMDYALIIDSFQTRLSGLIKYFGSLSSNRIDTNGGNLVGLTDAKDLAKIIKAAGDGGIKIDRKIYRSPTEYSVAESIEFSPAEVKMAQEGVSAYIDANSLTEDADFKQVSLYFDRLNRPKVAGNQRSPEKGTVEIVSSRSLPVRWVSDLDDKRVKSIGANLFDLIFTVDIKVDYVRGKPVAYRVLKLHDWQSAVEEGDGEDLPQS